MRYIIVLLLFAASTVWAQPAGAPGDRDPFMGGGGPGRGVLKMLKLTDDQQKQLEKIQSDLQKKQIALRSKLETMRVDLRDLLRADSPDQAKIESQLTDISKVQNEMKLDAVGHWFSVNKMLTPEQQKIWKEHRRMMAMDSPPERNMRGGLKGLWQRLWHRPGRPMHDNEEKE